MLAIVGNKQADAQNFKSTFEFTYNFILSSIYLLKNCSSYGGSCHNCSPKSLGVLLESIL